MEVLVGSSGREKTIPAGYPLEGGRRGQACRLLGGQTTGEKTSLSLSGRNRAQGIGVTDGDPLFPDRQAHHGFEDVPGFVQHRQHLGIGIQHVTQEVARFGTPVVGHPVAALENLDADGFENRAQVVSMGVFVGTQQSCHFIFLSKVRFLRDRMDVYA